MTRKEIVYRAIEFRDPPRTPVNHCNRDLDESDTAHVCGQAAAGFVPSRPGETEWGYVWEAVDETMGQPKTHPLADAARIPEFIPPDPFAPGRFDALEAATCQVSGQFVKFCLGISGFNQTAFLRGFQSFLMDLYMDLPLAERLLDMVFDFETALIEQTAPFGIDAIAFGDDWGTQEGLIIDPALWRQVFRPRYARQFERAHAAGKKVWFHTCGNVWEIIGDLIDIGVDVLELLQPDVFGVERLACEFGGKTCFCCSVDHQRRAISGTRSEIFEYAQLLRDRLGAYHGGFIGYVEDYRSLGMSEQNYQWIREAFHGLGPAHS